MGSTSEDSGQGARTPADLSETNRPECVECDIARRFGSLIESRSNVIVCLSPDHSILEFNRAAELLYGHKREAVLGQDYVKLFIPKHQREAVAAEFKQVLIGRLAQSLETSIHTPDGSERTLLWSVSRILDAAGQPSGVIAVGQDISERKQGEEALRRYEHIVRTSGDLMAFVDTDYVYQAVNVSYVNTFGKTRDRIVGHAVADLFGHELFRTQIKPNLDRCQAGERVRHQLWWDTPQSARRCLDVELNPFRDSDGSVSGVVVASRDITEQKQAEQELIEHQQQLRTLASGLALAGQRERQRVAIGLHDQVGQALAIAQLKLGLALESELSADARRALEDSQTLLDQSIQATRSLTFQLSSTVLRELGLAAALQQLIERVDADSDDTRYIFAVDKQPKPVGEDTGLMLYDIARELLFNATKYAQARTVSLGVERVGDRLQIIIEDDGVGFDTDCLDDGHCAEGGFGYFSIRERLAYLGGELEVKSSIGHGTRIVAAVPLQKA